jgi:cysteine desulfurase
MVGSQERARRGGTEAVPLIVGFGKATELAKADLKKRAALASCMRNRLELNILKYIPSAYINGDTENRLPNTLNVSVPSIDSDMIVQLMGRQDIMISNGSACKSHAITPSHVLVAMGISHEAASEALRFSVSHLTKDAEVDTAISILKELVVSMQG